MSSITSHQQTPKKYSSSAERLSSFTSEDISRPRSRKFSEQLLVSEVIPAVDSRKSSKEHKRGLSIFSRSSSLLSLTNWLRRGKSASRKDRKEEAVVDTEDDEEGEKIEYKHSRSQAWMVNPSMSFVNSLSTNASMGMSSIEMLGQSGQITSSRYLNRYEDLIEGRADNIDPKRLERFLHPDDCLEVLGIPKIWIRMIKPSELRERKQRAGLTESQYHLNKHTLNS